MDSGWILARFLLSSDFSQWIPYIQLFYTVDSLHLTHFTQWIPYILLLSSNLMGGLTQLTQLTQSTQHLNPSDLDDLRIRAQIMKCKKTGVKKIELRRNVRNPV